MATQIERRRFFTATAIAEIVGCYLPFLWLRKGGSPWLALPALLALTAFAGLLTLHPTGVGRTYAAYGGVYVATAVVWLWLIEGQRPDRSDVIGAAVCIVAASERIRGARSGAASPPEMPVVISRAAERDARARPTAARPARRA